MKVAVVCNRDDNPILVEMDVSDPEYHFKMLDLLATALSVGRKLIVVNLDNSGTFVEREYNGEAVRAEPSTPCPPPENYQATRVDVGASRLSVGTPSTEPADTGEG